MRRFIALFLATLFAASPAFAGSGTITIKDGAGASQVFDVTTDGSGNFLSKFVICDQSAGAVCATITGSNALKVDGSAVTQPVSGTFWQATQPVSGTVAATQSGTWTDRIVGNGGAAMDAAGQNVASPANELLTGCQFNTSPTTITSTNMSPVQCDNGGKLLVNPGTVTVTGTVTANAGTNLNTSTLALEAGGNLATIAGAVSSSKVQDNVAQINGTAPTMKATGTNAATTDTSFVVAQSPNPNTLCTSSLAINQTSSTDLVTSVAKLHICSIVLVSATAQNLSLTEGTGTVCATNIAALIGGTTASVAVAANGGFSAVSDRAWLITKTTADHLCLLQSGAGNVSGVITYTDHN